jgi:hypothetical protein
MWLSENPDKGKEFWSRWKFNGGDVDRVHSFCFACECSDLTGDCEDCPLDWTTETCCGMQDDGLFCLWEDSKDLSERSRLAKDIAELPVKEGVEYI